MRGARLLLLGLALAAPASAAPPVLSAGARTGAHWPLQSQLTLGPLFGANAEYAFHPLLSVGLTAEGSLHSVTSRGVTHPVTRAGAGVFGRYRFDLARLLPYVEGALLGQYLGVQGFQPTYGLAASAAFGLHLPLWAHFYADAQVRYGYVLETGRFPAGASVELGFGWRSGSL